MTSRNVLSTLRDAAGAMISRNLAHLGVSSPGATPPPAPPRRIPMWDLPAKWTASQRIAWDEKRLHAPHQNDLDDAKRHAEWAQRSSNVAGPVFTTAAGIAHEIKNMLPPAIGGDGQPFPEAIMDLHNNAEGVRAFQEGRPINPQRLLDQPFFLSGYLRRQMSHRELGR